MREVRPNLLALAGLIPALLATACGDAALPMSRAAAGEAEVTGQGILVIAIDGLRWDHTSLAGYDRDTTPELRRLAEESVVFENAWSVTPSLVGSHVAILSGADPGFALPPDVSVETPPSFDVGSARNDRWFLPEGLQLLGRPFLGHGWTTAAFVDDPMIAELRGFDRGFREFVEHRGDPDDETREEGVLGVGRRFIEWANARDLDEDWFAYLHMHDLERSWKQHRVDNGLMDRPGKGQPADWKGRKEMGFVPPLGLVDESFHTLPPSRANRARPVTLAEYELRYDDKIRDVDHLVGRIILSVEDYGRKDNLTVVILGSFGTSLGEHGLYLQAGLAEAEDLHVPLLIRPSKKLREALGWQGEAPPRGRVQELVGLMDLAPTLVDLIGASWSGPCLGASMRPLLAGRDGPIRERLPARSTMVPGLAIIEQDTRAVHYDPSRAVAPARRSWTGAPEFEDRSGEVQLRWHNWELLVEQERRALHYGVDVDEGQRVQELRAMQGVD